MSYEVGRISPACPYINEHIEVLRETGHFVIKDKNGGIRCRFLKIHDTDVTNPIPLGNTPQEAQDNLWRALQNGVGFTLKCRFKYGRHVRAGRWVMEMLCGDRGPLTAHFVGRVVKYSPHGHYSGL